MSVGFFDSDKIKVFPCAYRGDGVDLYSRLNAEYNFANNYTISGGNDSYIISWDNSLLKCVIGGYYFEINGITSDISKSIDTKYKYLSIYLSALDSSNKSKVLCKISYNNDTHTLSTVGGQTLDENNQFCGLIYRDSIPADETGYITLQILDNNNNINADVYYNKINGLKIKGEIKSDSTLPQLSITKNVDISAETNITPSLFNIKNSSGNFIKITQPTTISAPVSVSGTTSIASAVAINGGANVSINKPVSIMCPFTVGGVATNSMTLVSGGLNSNIYGPDGNIHLPNDSTSSGLFAFTQNNDGSSNLNPGMTRISASNTADTIVQRDGYDIKASSFSLGNSTAGGHIYFTRFHGEIYENDGGNGEPPYLCIDAGTYNRNSNVIWIESKNLKIYPYDGTNRITGNTTLTGNLTVNGTLSCDSQITAKSFYADSDKRLKENIIEYKPKKSLLDLPIYKYDFIDGAKNQIGCLAQDLQEICPEIVNQNEDGYLSIQESKIVYLLLDEVKKLKKEIEEIKK